MEKQVNCQCQTGCTNKRCSCNKRFEGCGKHCECSGCDNPYNDVNREEYATCALDHIEQVQELSKEEREETHQLLCGHRSVKVEHLLDTYECPDCGSYYWYSFCRNGPEPDSQTWHCQHCGECRDWRWWHCDDCNKCTYGVTLECEHCGKDGPMADMTE